MAEDIHSEIAANPHPEKFKKDVEKSSEVLLNLFKSKQGEVNPKIKAAAENPMVQHAITKLKKNKGLKDISKNDLEVLNKRFMSGHLPRHKGKHGTTTCDDDDDEVVVDHGPTKTDSYLAMVLAFQLRIALKARDFVFKHASKVGHNWLRTMIPTTQIATLMSFLVYTYILNVNFLSFFLPLLLFTVAFAVLSISTLHSLRGEKRFMQFVAWSDLLTSVESALNVYEAEDNYFKNHISPVLSLPVAVILMVMSFAVCPQESMPISELALVSFVLYVTCLYSFNQCLDPQASIAIACQIFATLLEGFNRFSPDTPNWSLSLPVTDSLQINLSLSALIRLESFVLAVSLPFQSKHRSKFVGLMRNLVPALFVMMWWELFSLFFYYSSITGLLRASAEAVVLFFSVPAALLLFVYGIFKFLASLHLLQILVTILLIAVPFLYLKFTQHGYKFMSQIDFSFIGPALKIIIYTLLVILLLTVFVSYRPSGLQVLKSPLTWKEYSGVCRSHGQTNNAISQRVCHQLNGHHVNWTGTAVAVKITSIENKFESVANILPTSLANWLSCFYGEGYVTGVQSPFGEKNHASGAEEMWEASEYRKQLFFMSKHSQRACHLDRYNKYQFSITANMNSGDGMQEKINILASDGFKHCIFHLKPGMKINYQGIIDADARSVNIYKLIIVGENYKFGSFGTAIETITAALDESISGLVRFIFAPFITTVATDELD